MRGTLTIEPYEIETSSDVRSGVHTLSINGEEVGRIVSPMDDRGTLVNCLGLGDGIQSYYVALNMHGESLASIRFSPPPDPETDADLRSRIYEVCRVDTATGRELDAIGKKFGIRRHGQ